MGVWEETPKSSNWKSFSKTVVPIALHRNGSYDNMIASVIEVGKLTCVPNDLVISYQMNGRGKIHPTFIKNDRHVSLYMLDIGIDGSRPILRINVNAITPIEPTNSFNDDNDSIRNERLGDHSKESLGLLEKSCSCREYDLIEIPCAHAMAALRSKHGNEYGMSIYEYSLPLYKVEAYLLAYMDSINVVPLELEWCAPEELLNVKILLPLVNTKLGRKRRKCVKGVGENFKSKRRNKFLFVREPDTRELHV
ncbi:hypothetical protein H5410_060271 [Solanum commersonii]|uniref:SWIM-type domain-containing protein n=1 Tax=Solanum commersonii TaxID=4109 RepID=A0A9J5W502_SOLCO|nr:hypothetical protein H5410_060271 [Solanum commersonii]